MKPGTLQVLQREARLRGNRARLQLQTAQVTLDEKARALAALIESRRAVAERLQRYQPATRERVELAARRERWQKKLRTELAALDAENVRARDDVRACEATVEQLRRDVTEALHRKQATETLERALRDAEIRQRERRAQGLLDEVSAWRATRQTHHKR